MAVSMTNNVSISTQNIRRVWLCPSSPTVRSSNQFQKNRIARTAAAWNVKLNQRRVVYQFEPSKSRIHLNS